MTTSLRARAGRIACVLLLLALPLAHPSAQTGWKALDEQAAALYTSGQMEEAIAVARKALVAAVGPLERGQSLGRLGFILHASGQMEEGARLLRESLQVRRDAFGEASMEYAQAAHDLAVSCRDTGKTDEAITLAERAVAIRRRELPPTDPRVPESLDTLGSIHGTRGDYARAIPFFEEALAMHEAIPVEQRGMEEYGVMCINLGGTYQRLGKYEQAEATLTKGREALRIKPGTEHLAYSLGTIALATLKADLGKFPEAEALHDEGIQLLETGYPTHPMFARALNNRGVMYRSMGNLELAERDLTRALALHARNGGEQSILAATSRANLGQLTARRDKTEGERQLRAAAGDLAAAKAPPYEQVNALVALGRLERERGAAADAEATLLRAQAIAEPAFGTRHQIYGAVLRELGLARQAAGRGADAARALGDALAIAEHAHGPRSPYLLPFLRATASVQVQRGEADAALATYRRAVDIEDAFLNDVFAIGSEAFKEGVLRSFSDPVDALVAFQQHAGATAPAARQLAFEAATRRKGRVLEQVRHWRQRLRGVNDAATLAFLAEWEALVRCRTSLALALGDRSISGQIVGGCGLDGTPMAGRYERLLSEMRGRWAEPAAARATAAVAEIEAREQELETTLVRRLGPTAAPRESVDLTRIAAALRKDEALLEIVAYPTGEAPNDRKRYGAFVVDAGRSVAWIDLGAAAGIERAVGDLLAAANDWSVSSQRGEVRSARIAAATASVAMDALSRQVWTPLEAVLARLSGVARVRVAPDSALNLVPFEAMTAADGRPVIARYAVTYVPAGRDLVRPRHDGPRQPPVFIVSAGSGARAATFRGEALPALPGAESEAAELAARLADAQVYRGASASEQRVKGLTSPFIVHLMGHGRVGSRGPCVGAGCAPSAGTASGAAMVSSAIFFREAYAAVPGSSEDGVLTAAELQDVDLRDTAMLVLSHCQMASGLASVGEGVYGMRRAAAVAGASSFVAPLWNVEDRVQRTLMRRFYRGLVAGQDRADALRAAKLAIRKTAATRSFLYWAPVILAGETAPLPLAAAGVVR